MNDITQNTATPAWVEPLKDTERFLPMLACQPPTFWNFCRIPLPWTHLIWEITTFDFRYQQSIWEIHSYSSFTLLQWCSPPHDSSSYNASLGGWDTSTLRSLFLGRKALLHLMNQKLGDRASKSALSEAVVDQTWKAAFGFPVSLFMKKVTGHRGRIRALPCSSC